MYKNLYNNNTFRLLSKFDKVFKLTLTNDGYVVSMGKFFNNQTKQMKS